MHLTILLLVILSAWRWAEWKHWRKYLPSMQFIVIGALLYEYITKDQRMWIFQPDIPNNQTFTTLMHKFLTMPLTVLIYLSRFPKTVWRQCCHMAAWIGMYIIVETVMMLTGRIYYENGWNLWHSFLFNLMMFPMLRLHDSRPVAAYLLSIPIVLSLIYWFNIYVP